MEPRIQYAKTSDGVSIGYCLLGEGTPLVYTSNIWGDLQWYLNDEASRKSVDQLVAEGWRVIRYDGRGTGSSERDVTDFSLEGRVRDLRAVIDCLDVERFVLCGYGQGGSAAIAYSVEQPDRVSHLVLVNSFASGSAYYEKIPAMRALIDLRSMAQEQWEFFTITLATAATGFKDAVRAKSTAQLFRTAMSAEAFLSYVEAAREIDVTALLPMLRVATLVVQDSSGFDTEDLSRHLASRIPDACFVSTDDYTEELHAFVLGRTMEKRPLARQSTPPGSAARTDLTVILFADIADSTALTERLGDAAFRDKARDLDDALRRAISSNGGTAIEGKLLGDGVLATFGAAREAIACAASIHEAGSHTGLALHVGIHAGDVIREDNNVFGGAVNIAARVASEAAAGETLVSATVRELARTSAGPSAEGFEDRGERELKGVGEPVRVWAVVGAN
ncbi:MAG: adenylate/guanylate cyclase domain-containing protein [Dehalococcoidia bacterium]